ncbi:MAG: hypothetical protein J5725_00795 [Bacteroidales bacterium]|nr:hypothetical protein [Bacteroidales bacterium]
MYALSTEAKKDLQSYTIYNGTIGSESFDNENILKGSLSFSNRCSDSSTFGLGGVYIGQMSCSFMGIDIPENEWKGKEISLSVRINDAQTIPLHTYYVDEASKTKGIMVVKCYDGMAKFDKAVSVDIGAYGSVFEWLTLVCTSCGMTLGMTQQEVEALPNGNQSFYLEEMGDIETWRDIIFWLSVKVVGFATMDRNGNLILCTYHSEVDDTLDANIRYNTSSYGDEIVAFSGISVYVTSEEKNYYYHNDPDIGYTLNLGNDPFMQVTKAQREVYIDNMLAAIGNIQYCPCDVTIPFGAHYDLGDVLQFPNGQGSSTKKFCIMGYDWTYYGGYRIHSIAGVKNSMSKTDKNLQGLLSSVGRNEFTSYEQRNVGRITIANNDRERLLLARIASNNSTKAQIHIEVNLQSVANTPSAEFEDFADIWDAISDTAVKGIVSYFINSEEYDFQPTETFIDGKHVLHLMFILPLEANNINIFEVYMRSIGGTITIPPLGIWFYASGAGLIGDGKWDGNINFQDDVESWNVIENTFENAMDFIVINSVAPETFEFIEASIGWNVIENSFENAVDDITATFHTDVFRRITEDGDVRVTEDDDVRYTEGD